MYLLSTLRLLYRHKSNYPVIPKQLNSFKFKNSNVSTYNIITNKNSNKNTSDELKIVSIMDIQESFQEPSPYYPIKSQLN